MKHIIPVALLAISLWACSGGSEKETASAADEAQDTVVVEQPDLVADSVLTSAAQYYADKVNSPYTVQRLAVIDSMSRTDMNDLREKCTFAFYPFGGPDFLYPHHIFPNADVYFLMGLEKPGTAPSTIDASKVGLYSNSLRDYLGVSFYVTKNMMEDLATEDIDGALPLIAMLIAKDGCQIMSISYKKLDENGNMVDADQARANIAQVEFFATATPKRKQTLYFYSGNTDNSHFEAGLKAYLDRTLPQYKVATFLKAASYLMHYSFFSTIRNYILDNSFAVLEDDSAIPYRNFEPSQWDFTLYGAYVHPISLFSENCYQADLDSLYKREAAAGNVKPLPLRIGYNRKSNWMVARKK